jgi:hypothetical protein
MVKGHKLVSPSCCVPKKVAFTVESGSFPFRYKSGRGRYARGKDSQASDMPAEIAWPSAELCWTAPLPGTSRAIAEVEEPADLSHARG